MFNKKYFSLITLLLLIVLIFPLISCTNQANAKDNLYIYLTNTAEDAVTQLDDEYSHYLSEASRKDAYEEQLAYLKKSRFTNSQSFYSDMVFVGGYWVSNGEEMINTHWVSYKKDPSGELIYDYTDMFTESFIIETYDIFKDIEQSNIDVKWAGLCQQEEHNISTKLEILEKLLSKWEISHKDWQSNEVGENVISISGQDLGIHTDSPCTGKWYYYTDSGKFKPADSYAENLQVIMEKIPTYEQKKTSSDISIPEYELEPANYSWLSYRHYYNLPESVPLKIKYSRQSEMAQSLFQQYPKVKEYWDMLEEMGFTVTCTIVDENNGYEGDYNILIEVTP